MSTTVHEDDLRVWYRIPEPITNISMRDFDLDEDLFPEEFPFVQTERERESIDLLLPAPRTS